MSYIDVALHVLEPWYTLAVAIAGPLVIGLITMKLSGYLGIKDAAAQKQLEAQIRDALHQSAENGLKAVLAKLGMSAATNAGVLANPEIIKDAMDYVRRLNPQGADKVSAGELRDIVLSKVPDITIDNNPVPVVAAPVRTAAKK